MRTWTILAAMLVLAMAASLVMAEEAKAKTARGAITKIDGVNVSVGDVTFATTDATTVTTAGGEKKAVSDLAVGQNIVVKLSDDGKSAATIVIAAKNAAGGRQPE